MHTWKAAAVLQESVVPGGPPKDRQQDSRRIHQTSMACSSSRLNQMTLDFSQGRAWSLTMMTSFATLEGYQHKGFLTKVDTLDEVRQLVNGEPILYRSWAA